MPSFTVGAVQLINIVGHAGRFAISKPFGRYSDKHSYAKGVELALLLAILGFLVLICTTPATRFLIIGYSLLYNMCQAGISGNMINITYSYVDSRYFVQASAIKNSIGGICGFLSSLVGSRILKAIQNNGNRILGIPVYGQQFLAGITVVLLTAALLYNRFVISKQTVMKQ